MKEQQRLLKQEIYQLCIVVALLFIFFLGIIFFAENTEAVKSFSNGNATIVLFDDGDRDRSATSIRPGVGEVNTLFANEQGNAGSSIYFYANYSLTTGQSIVNTTGTSCDIQFDNAAGGSTGPFSMIENTTINLFEYNRTIQRNGTFWWNASCRNPDIGTPLIREYDEVRLFNNTCFRFVTGGLGELAIDQNALFCASQANQVLVGSQAVTLFEITKDNITVDCNGTRFETEEIGSFDSGFSVFTVPNSPPPKGVILKNCYFRDLPRAVVILEANNTLLYNNTFLNVTPIAINASNGQNLTVILNNFTSAPLGRIIDYSNFNVTNFSNNNITGLQRGLEFVNMHRNFVFNNTIKNNTLYGLRLHNSSNNTILWNNISNNSGQGILVSAGDDKTISVAQPEFVNLLANNTICANGQEGILFNNTRIGTSPILDGLLANNTFCNTTAGVLNRDIAAVHWVIEVQVVNATNTSIVDASVNVTDADNGTSRSALFSNSTGGILPFNITQFIVNNSAMVINKTPTNFVGAKNTEKTNLTQLINQASINRFNTVITLNLSQDATAPNVTQVTPTSGTESIAINFRANATDQIGIQSCNLFSGTTNTSTTNFGVMDYTAASGLFNRTVTYSSNGGFTVYANCTDNGGNIGFNFTSISISPLTSGGGGGDAGGAAAGAAAATGEAAAAPTAPGEEEAAAEEVAAEEEAAPAEEVAPAEEEAAQTAAQAAAAEGKSGQEILELIERGEVLALDYGLSIEKVIANGEVIYENGRQVNTITIKDEDILELIITITNIKETAVEDIIIGMTGIPEELQINEINPKTIASLAVGETKSIKIELESGDIEETFLLQIHAEAAQASATLALNTILEAGKGAVYYTRQKIIEETKEIITRTYKFLFLLFLIPLLLLLRATTLADEKALRRMLEDKTITNYWRIYVPEAVYPKYNVLQNLKPIMLEDQEREKAQGIAAKAKISYDLATLILFAKQKLIPRIFTMGEIPKELHQSYPRIWFTSPLRNYKEDQLQRYIETQQAKGFSNNEIRQTLLNAKWKPVIIKKYLDPEEDIKAYIALQQQQGKSLGDIRKQLIDAKWDKAIVDGYVSRESVLQEYITLQRKKGKDTATIRKELLKVCWEKELISKFLNPEDEVKAFTELQKRKGMPLEQIKKQLLAVKWKKEIIEKYLK